MTGAEPRGGIVLILAPTGRDAGAASDLLRRAGIGSRVCSDFAAFTASLDEADTAFVAEEGLIGQRLDLLAD